MCTRNCFLDFAKLRGNISVYLCPLCKSLRLRAWVFLLKTFRQCLSSKLLTRLCSSSSLVNVYTSVPRYPPFTPIALDRNSAQSLMTDWVLRLRRTLCGNLSPPCMPVCACARVRTCVCAHITAISCFLLSHPSQISA